MKLTLAIAKGIALGAAMIAVAVLAGGCEGMPTVTVRGTYADYSYSAKSGVLIAPRITRIIIEK